MTTSTPRGTERPRRPTVAATLSFIWPGLGQAYAARPRWAALLGLPVLALAIYVGLQLASGVELFAVQLLDPEFARWVVIVTAVLGIWRLIAIAHAFVVTARGRRVTRSAATVLAVLVAAVVAMHGVVGYYAYSFLGAGEEIFQPEPSAPPVAHATPNPSFSLAPGATPTPAPTPRPPTNRVTFLLTGVDSGHDRDHALTDTLLVVSVDTVDKTAVMLSVPRDISNFPLYSGGTYFGKINSLMTAARLDPKRFPDGPNGTLAREIGFIVGVPIDYVASINLDGFVRMIDLVGGVDVDNPRAIDDPRYDWFDGTFGFTMSAGRHHLNGRIALAYVRSRQGVGDSDFTRSRRQQQVLVALKSKMTTPAALARLPDLLAVAGRTIRTDFPASRVREFLGFAREIGNDGIQQAVLGPPYAKTPSQPTGTYVLLIDFDAVAKLSIRVFGTDSNYYGTTAGVSP